MTNFGSIFYGRMKQCHPRLDLSRISVLHAMYRGGDNLLRNPAVMSAVFPKYTYENPHVYSERKERAFYENIFSVVVNQISAGLAQDPIHMESGGDSVDGFWSGILDNSTPMSQDGSNAKSFDQLMRDTAVEALVTGWSWIQCDLPVRQEVSVESLRDQIDAGLLRAYCVLWPTNQVVDWEEIDGQILWVRTYECESVALTPNQSRDDKTHRWTVWGPDTWAKYELVERKNQALPGDEFVINPVAVGAHSFGRVPWCRFDLSKEGVQLHVGGIIESLCRNYFNRQNGESFQWTQYNYQQLYEFLGPEISGIDTIVSTAQQDIGRGTRIRAPGMVHVRGAEDRAEFVGPDMTGAEVGRNALKDMRDSIFRATAQMALSQDTSGAMLRRSADSKRMDSVAGEIVLGAIGKRLVVLANHVAGLLAAGRSDPTPPPRFVGYQRFDVEDADTVINQAVLVDSLKIPSATFQLEDKYQTALVRLGDNTSEDVKSKIRSELEGAITQEKVMAQVDQQDPAAQALAKKQESRPNTPGDFNAFE